MLSSDVMAACYAGWGVECDAGGVSSDAGGVSSVMLMGCRV